MFFVSRTAGYQQYLVVKLFTGHRSPVILPVIFVTTLECPHIVPIVDTLMSTMIERLRAYVRAAVAVAVAMAVAVAVAAAAAASSAAAAAAVVVANTALECPHIVLIVDALMSTIIERVRAYISQEDYWATKGKSR